MEPRHARPSTRPSRWPNLELVPAAMDPPPGVQQGDRHLLHDRNGPGPSPTPPSDPSRPH
jgi:hypothetical protein